MNAVARHTRTLAQCALFTALLVVATMIQIPGTVPFTLQTMADRAAVHEKYLCRIFKEFTGRTPIDYVNQLRIDQACIDLVYACSDPGKPHLIERIESRNGIHTVEAAAEHGFGSREYELIEV